MSQQIHFTYDLEQASFAALTNKLRELAGTKANTYIARALNKTAVTARKKLASKAQDAYTVKTRGFNSEMQIKKATSGDLVAEIKSHGNTLDVDKFHWSKGGKKTGAKINVVKAGLKPIHKNEPKAFVGGGSANGKVYYRKGKSRLPIEKVKSKSVPYMIGSNRVFVPTRSEIESDLKKYMQQQIKALLG